MRLGEMVKEAREFLGLSIIDVAKHIPMDDRYIRQIEISTVIPGEIVVRRLSAALRLDPVIMEKQRRTEYAEREVERNSSVPKRSTVNVGVAPMEAKSKSAVLQQKEEAIRKELINKSLSNPNRVTDTQLPPGYVRHVMYVHPEAWKEVLSLQADSVTEIGMRASIDDLFCAAIQTIYDFKHGLGLPDKTKFKYTPKVK